MGRWPSAMSARPSSDLFETLSTTGHAFDIIESGTAYKLIAGKSRKSGFLFSTKGPPLTQSLKILISD